MKEQEWRAKAGDLFQFVPQGNGRTKVDPILVCLVLEDTPDTPEATTKVQFITGNKFMNKGFITPVYLTSPSYIPLEER